MVNIHIIKLFSPLKQRELIQKPTGNSPLPMMTPKSCLEIVWDSPTGTKPNCARGVLTLNTDD